MSAITPKKIYPLTDEDLDGTTSAPLSDSPPPPVEVFTVIRSCSETIEPNRRSYPLDEEDLDGSTSTRLTTADTYRFAAVSDEEEIYYDGVRSNPFRKRFTTSTPTSVMDTEGYDADDKTLLVQAYPDNDISEHLVRLNRQDSFSEIKMLQDVTCGFYSFRPRWLQRFATRNWYLAVHCYLGVVQGMYYTYLLSVLSTIQKRFGITSSTTGLLLSGNEVSQILFSLFLAHYGGRGNRPLWIGAAMALSSLSMFLLSFPHITFGAGLDVVATNATGAKIEDTSAVTSRTLCLAAQDALPCDDGAKSWRPVFVFYLGFVLQGAGSICYYSLGLPYLDDNSEAKKAPIYLGITFALRCFGAFLGFLLGFACLRVFISPSMDVSLSYDDVQWMGAWWLGFIIIGCLLLLGSLVMSMFPTKLPNREERKGQFVFREANVQIPPYYQGHILKELPSIREMPQTIKSLLKNPVIISCLCNSAFATLAGVGFFTFLPTYLESQFRTNPSKASIYTGLSVVLGPSVAFIVSGIVLRKLRPSASKVKAWNVILAGMQVVALITLMFFSCSGSHVDLQGEIIVKGTLNLNHSCNNVCECSTQYFNPVCDLETNISYYSPCYAGCSHAWYKPSDSALQSESMHLILKDFFEKLQDGGRHELYTGCSCLADPNGVKKPADEDNEDTGSLLSLSWLHLFGVAKGKEANKNHLQWKTSEVISGFCEGDCNQLVGYVVTLALVIAIASSGKVGTLLILLRSVEPKDKAMMIGLFIFGLSLIAFIPSQIIFGAAIDGSCLVWKENCGDKSNCAFYNSEKFRYLLHGLAAGFLSIAAIFDVIIYFKSRNLKLYQVTDKKSFEMASVKEPEEAFL